ncbi:F-box protein CPR1-like [Spinacia oleracea]|uniref:F-box protein CPR1-like n=1 Tax=Spinacia oleracea TaxID=3562 RepID=A0ABM3RW68_SPIOL|nr:F-box protein CPR1-like [Spinacia oleracea]
MSALPTEIIAEILSRLPVKPLVQLKCVCKSWESLIKCPNFIKIHINQTLISNTDRHLLVSSQDSSLHSADLDLHPSHLSFSEHNHPLKHRKVVNILGSCNGVICISDDSKSDVFLYNPLTNSNRKLPANITPNLKEGSILFGFGYDSKSDDYKVLRLVQGFKFDKSCCNEAHVYSLNNNSWKAVQGMPHFPLYGDIQGVLVNDALHYIVISEELSLQQRLKIASFDLSTERFSLMKFPRHDHYLKTNWDHLEFYLRNLGGYLCVAVNYQTNAYAHTLPSFIDNELRNNMLYRADILVMKEYGNKESWNKLFSTCKMKLFPSCLSIKPVVYSKDGQKILLDIDSYQVGWYDSVSRKFEKLKAHELPNMVHPDSVIFVASLVSLEDKLHAKRGSLPKNNKSKESANFLSAGFKLKL